MVYTEDHFAHIDPDLRKDAYPRMPGWRPLFGQSGSAQWFAPCFTDHLVKDLSYEIRSIVTTTENPDMVNSE